MRKVQGVGFGVRFYRRPAAKTPVKNAEKENPIMQQNKAVIQTTIDMDSFCLAPSAEALGLGFTDRAVDVIFPIEQEPVVQVRMVVKPAENKMKEAMLWAAARAGDCRKIRALVMDGADLNARDPQGRTAINIATQYKQMDALKTLMAAKEMRYMAQIGDLPDTRFFQKFRKVQGA